MAAEDLEKARERVDKASVPMIMRAIGELRSHARTLHIRGADLTSSQLDLVCDVAAIHLCDSLVDPSKADGLARRCTTPPRPW